MEKQTALVAILPQPLTTAALFGYGILRFLGYVGDRTYLRFSGEHTSPPALFGCEERIIDLRLHTGKLYPQILNLGGSEPTLKHVLRFASSGEFGDEVHYRLGTIVGKLVAENECREALREIHELVARLVEQHSSIWKSIGSLTALLDKLESRPKVTETTQPYPTDTRYLPLVKYIGDIQGHKNITKRFDMPIKEGRIFALQNRHVNVVIGGPPNSGKSTLAVSVVAAMNGLIKSLKSRQSFAGLQMRVGFSTLDPATPTGDAIFEGWSGDVARVINLKEPWTMDLARTAQRGVLRAREKYNVVISDLPGRATEDHTELLVSSADAGILIGNYWPVVQKEWIPLMMGFGVPIISKISSHQENSGLSSGVTRWESGERLNGQIVGLDRTERSPDLFVQCLANFLLFDLLPTKFGEKEEKHQTKGARA